MEAMHGDDISIRPDGEADRRRAIDHQFRWILSAF
jgi:hypothetical protein